MRGVLPLHDDVAVIVELLGEHRHLPADPVDDDAGLLRLSLRALVSAGQRTLESLDDGVEGDALLPLDAAQCLDLDLHLALLAHHGSTWRAVMIWV